MEEKKKQGISESVIKYIILTTMCMDHFAAAVLDRILAGYGVVEAQSIEAIYAIFDKYPNAILICGIDFLLRSIGRLAFPLVCFTLVEGFVHTTSKKKYICRLTALAIVSEIPYDYARKGEIINLSTQNTIFTLLIALLCLCIIEKIRENYVDKNKFLEGLFVLLTINIGCLLEVVLKSDYGVYGFLAIMCMYLFKKKKMLGNILGIVILCLNSLIEVFAFFDLILIHKYNGTRGKANKWLFYLFYPIHLLVLGMIANLV